MSTTAVTTVPATEAAARVRVIDHLDVAHGFCMVCGAVWPCSRARRDQRTASSQLR